MPADDPTPPIPVPGSFWQRRVVRPIRAQLTQGVSADQIASTLGIGTACSVFPLFGFTTLLNLGAGLALRLNHPILQTLNQLLGPLQLVLILPYVRLGEIIWGAPGGLFTLDELLHVFREASLVAFLERFGWAGVHAVTAWLLTSPLLIAAVLFLFRPLLRRAASRLRPASAAAVRP
ncbi:MAG: DUF2062 domain-containing protein [Phycisphaerales bacterium]|jgi:uncharacterized protein (DUF2062 family)